MRMGVISCLPTCILLDAHLYLVGRHPVYRGKEVWLLWQKPARRPMLPGLGQPAYCELVINGLLMCGGARPILASAYIHVLQPPVAATAQLGPVDPAVIAATCGLTKPHPLDNWIVAERGMPHPGRAACCPCTVPSVGAASMLQASYGGTCWWQCQCRDIRSAWWQPRSAWLYFCRLACCSQLASC